MKILHICGDIKNGGVATFVKSIIRKNEVSQTKHDVLLLFSDEIPANFPFAKIFSFKSILNNPIKLIIEIKKVCDEYDAIMLHKAHPFLIIWLIFIKNKYFIFQHGMSLGRANAIKKQVKKIFYSLAPILLKAKVICSTEFALQKTIKRGINIPDDRVVIIPFGIDIKRKKAPIAPIKREIIVGTAGILTKIKRFDILIKSLQNYHGDLNIHLKIAGEGIEKNYLEKLASRLKNPQVKIEFLGWVEDIISFYDSLHLFAFPSHNESFGLVVLEALSRNIPVVVFEDLGGVLSIIKNKKNGVILKKGIDNLTEFWEQLDANANLLIDISRFISEMDLSEYDISLTRNRLENLVKD